MRVLAVFAGAFSLGIFLAQYGVPPEHQVPLAAIFFLLACVSLLLPGRWHRRGLLICTALSLALGWNWLFVRQVQAPMEALAGRERGGVTVMLADWPQETGFGARAVVRVEGLPRGKAIYYGGRELLELRPGQTISGAVSFQSAEYVREEHIRNFTAKGIFLLIYPLEGGVSGPGTADSVRWWPARLGRMLRVRTRTLFSGDTAGFLTGILTGDKSRLSDSASAALSDAGLSHILAVSGMHCGFLLTLAVLLTGRHRHRLTAALTIPLLICYALLTGGSPSVVRACVMLSFLLAAPLFRRDSDPPTAMAAALFLILLADPFAAASVSLQLSFGAVSGLLFLTPRLSRVLLGSRKRGRCAHFAAAGFSATMGALLFTVPLSAWYFGTLSLLAPLSNFLCLWAASLAFLSGLITVLVSFLSLPLGALLSVVPAFFSAYILRTAAALAQLPHGTLSFTNPYLKYWLLFVYLLFATAWLGREKSRRKYLLASILAAAMLVCTVRLGRLQATGGGMELMMLDVGQGECILMESDGEAALVDCGSANSWYAAGDLAAGWLSTLGCTELDTLILTHYDKDHVNGAGRLMAHLPVRELLVPDWTDDSGLRSKVLSAAEQNGVPVSFVTAPRTISMGQCTLTVFPPVSTSGDNECGLTILCTKQDYDILITGDMNAATERRLLAAYDLPDTELLVAGHHGSKSSTCRELLEAVTPETAFISVGFNRYGHPAPQTLRRLAMAGADIWRTDLHGTIHLTLH